jgi:hypothetical protein
MTGEPSSGALSLEQIEHDVWGQPPADATRLMCAAYELRRKPVALLTPEDLRLLIAQQIGVDVVMPYALALLENDHLVEGDFYPGDLLAAVMILPPEYWATHPREAAALRKIAGAAKEGDSVIQEGVQRFLAMTEVQT